MKYLNKISIIAILLQLIFTTGCEDEFLQEDNPNTITTASFWASESDFQKGLITVYGALQYGSVGDIFLREESLRSDVSRSFTFYGGPWSFSMLDWNASTAYVADRWSELYVGIFRANQVIENIQNFIPTDDFTEDEMAEIEAQARFLRAWFYFQLNKSYGQAVIHTTVPVTEDEFKKPLSDKEEVTTQVIAPDLHFARKVLPNKWSGIENKGRVTWGSSASLLGKVYLYEEEWDSAAFYLNEVLESGIYSLTSNIGDNFTTLNEFNSESIFEIAFNDTFNPGVGAASKEDVFTTQGAEAGGIAKQAASQLRGGWRTVVPNMWVHEMYEQEEPDPTLAVNNGNNYSTRAYWSIAFLRQDDGPLGGQFYTKFGDLRKIADWFNGGAETVYWKKYTNWYHWSAESPLSRSGINIRIIRLADVHLMYAEALLNAQGASALEEAREHVDIVRSRARVMTLDQYRNQFGGRIPQMHIRQTNPGPARHPLITLNVNSLLTHIQFVERVLELGFEGHRWYDLVRWELVEEAFENQNKYDYTDLELNPATGAMEPVDNGILEFCGEVCVEPDRYFLGRAIETYQTAQEQIDKYNPDLHDYFPIPQNELNTNNLLDL